MLQKRGHCLQSLQSRFVDESGPAPDVKGQLLMFVLVSAAKVQLRYVARTNTAGLHSNAT